MLFRIIAIGTKMPAWIETGYKDYAKRMQRDYKIECIELKQAKGHNLSAQEILHKEAQLINKKIRPQDSIITTDIQGQSFDTPTLAKHIEHWQQRGIHPTIIIGGAEGLDERIKQKAIMSWSLSPLTFPHPMVRVLVAEQLYRACSLICNHPYHRG